ncbi:class 1 fructose-bisphosphatase [Phenylobacterium sp. J426]|uniref:class 1 fructose-bisphosphatase n=1 Tax=Phenylobacterium sp. J426 TaxID=2898439 RepID=UPI00215086B9|nr:class 1 fructose-bisphosphatase [Phenylobacterium sp. J426]MCR5876628.1 class 1 fructose-bisphosphatase [Phenylobacterium sp. J426]
MPIRLEAILQDQVDHPAVRDVLAVLADACAEISRLVRSAAVAGQLGAAGVVNVQQEDQKALDVLTDELLTARLMECSAVAALASEEQADAVCTDRTGGCLVAFDPLDGSSNVDVNVSVGTIFSLRPAPDGRPAHPEDFLGDGRAQLAAGYAVYGPQSMLVMSFDARVMAFSLDEDGAWVLTHPALAVPVGTKEFAINLSNRRHWRAPVISYIEDCLAGRDGPRGKDFNMRWVGSMVADVHRILMRGGVFLYPWDAREPDRPGKLRMLYEAHPMALLVERAGGRATDGVRPLLERVPPSLHARTAVVLGSADEVERVRDVG